VGGEGKGGGVGGTEKWTPPTPLQSKGCLWGGTPTFWCKKVKGRGRVLVGREKGKIGGFWGGLKTLPFRTSKKIEKRWGKRNKKQSRVVPSSERKQEVVAADRIGWPRAHTPLLILSRLQSFLSRQDLYGKKQGPSVGGKRSKERGRAEKGFHDEPAMM